MMISTKESLESIVEKIKNGEKFEKKSQNVNGYCSQSEIMSTSQSTNRQSPDLASCYVVRKFPDKKINTPFLGGAIIQPVPPPYQRVPVLNLSIINQNTSPKMQERARPGYSNGALRKANTARQPVCINSPTESIEHKRLFARLNDNNIRCKKNKPDPLR